MEQGRDRAVLGRGRGRMERGRGRLITVEPWGAQRLPSEHGEPWAAHGRDELLLRMCRLADRYQLPDRCMDAIAEAMCALEIDYGALLSIFSLPEPILRLQAFVSLLSKGQAAVVSLFGDVPAVIIDKDKRAQFCRLPHSAVLSWLKAAGLKVSLLLLHIMWFAICISSI